VCPSISFDLDVVVTRGDAVESRHHVAAAVVDGSRLIGHARDPGMVTYWRSCAKPFQLLPFIESGQFDELGWGTDEIALACASHGGEPEHVAIVDRMLTSIGLEEGDLACGVQEPLSQRGARLLRESGERATRLHNNCSGKHAAMLARAEVSEWTAEGYDRAEHPVQRSITESVSQWTGVPEGELILGVDGCGVVVYALPLESMARAYARLGAAAARGEAAPSRIIDAMLGNPFLVGGTDRFDTVLMEETDGNILCKIGAEGVHSALLVDRGIGIAVKAEDGAVRAQYPALLALLQRLEALPVKLPSRLAEFAAKPVRNTRHEIVGQIRSHAAI
jgi:L-asparaginase II